MIFLRDNISFTNAKKVRSLWNKKIYKENSTFNIM